MSTAGTATYCGSNTPHCGCGYCGMPQPQCYGPQTRINTRNLLRLRPTAALPTRSAQTRINTKKRALRGVRLLRSALLEPQAHRETSHA